VAIRHTVPSGLPTGTVTGKVAGDDWRADHLHIPFSVELVVGNVTTAATGAVVTPAAASAAAGTELFSTAKLTRNKIDLSQATQARLVGNVLTLSSTATSSFKLSYCTAEASTWASGTGVADAGPALVVGSNGGAAGVIHDTGWVSLAAGARIDNCFLALLVGSAMGTTAATVGFITAYFK
jgi:hypothetical protein